MGRIYAKRINMDKMNKTRTSTRSPESRGTTDLEID